MSWKNALNLKFSIKNIYDIWKIFIRFKKKKIKPKSSIVRREIAIILFRLSPQWLLEIWLSLYLTFKVMNGSISDGKNTNLIAENNSLAFLQDN